MSKVFNYIRVSSKEQNEQRQIEAMNKFNGFKASAICD